MQTSVSNSVIGDGVSLGVLVIDECALVRDAMGRLLNKADGLHLAGATADAEVGLDTARTTQPAVVLLDIACRHAAGFDLIRKLRVESPRSAIIVCSAIDDVAYVENAMRLGARGYLSKCAAAEKVLHAIRQVLSGQIYLDDQQKGEFLSRLVDGHGELSAASLSKLSRAEFEVFHLIGNGMSNGEIAAALHRSIKTIETYRARIKEKLSLKSSTELARFAFTCQSYPGRANTEAARGAELPLPGSRAQKGNVLVVDDHSVSCAPLVKILSMHGFNARGAADGTGALAVLANQKIDLVITDIMMPRMDGVALMEAIRSHSEWCTIPIIVMTGLMDGPLLERARSIADKTLLKSYFEVEDLIRIISKFTVAAAAEAEELTSAVDVE